MLGQASYIESQNELHNVTTVAVAYSPCIGLQCAAQRSVRNFSSQSEPPDGQLCTPSSRLASSAALQHASAL
jgi:hypothetical protein